MPLTPTTTTTTTSDMRRQHCEVLDIDLCPGRRISHDDETHTWEVEVSTTSRSRNFQSITTWCGQGTLKSLEPALYRHLETLGGGGGWGCPAAAYDAAHATVHAVTGAVNAARADPAHHHHRC